MLQVGKRVLVRMTETAVCRLGAGRVGGTERVTPYLLLGLAVTQGRLAVSAVWQQVSGGQRSPRGLDGLWRSEGMTL